MPRQWRIFVVEDDESLLRHVVNALRKDGYVVRGATNKREAVRTLSAEEHDMVICDLKASDDIELLQWLRAYRPNVRVILVGAPNDVARAFALESGATSYIERPLDVSRLKEELHRLLAQTGFSASLDSFDLLDVIQIVSGSRRNIALLVSTGLEERGMLCFQEGNMVWAEYGTLRGEEAFFALAAHKNGTVIHQPWNQRVTPNVTQPLSRLIFKALQYRTKYAPQQAVNQQGVVHGGQVEQVFPTTSYEEDDTPFLVALEETTNNKQNSESIAQGQQIQQGYQGQQGQQGQIQQRGPRGVREMTFQGSAAEMPEPEELKRASKEWWQQTGKMTTQPSIPPVQRQTTNTSDTAPDTGNTTISRLSRTNVPNTPIFERPLSDSSGMRRVPPGMRKTHMRSETVGQGEQAHQSASTNKLPSWLTEQPSASELATFSTSAAVPMTPIPVVPVTPAEGSTHSSSPASNSGKLPQVPVTPKITPAEWQPPVAVDESKQDGNLQEMQGTQTRLPRAVRGLPSSEWQGGQGVAEPSQSGSLQRITASRLATTTIASPSEQGSVRVSGVSGPSGKQRAIKRNYDYASLVSALETLGYSMTGFIATAVVMMDGQPIAQVAVDDLDIAVLCQGLSQMMRTMVQLLQQGSMGEHEDTVITGGDRYVILRLIRDREQHEHPALSDEKAFQVLITTRKADTTECIGMMANVEDVIAAALRSRL